MRVRERAGACGSVRERAGAGACGIVRERAGAMYHKVGFVVSLRAARCRVTGFGGWRVHRDCASRSRIEITHRVGVVRPLALVLAAAV